MSFDIETLYKIVDIVTLFLEQSEVIYIFPLLSPSVDRCNTSFDAVARIRGETFFFKGLDALGSRWLPLRFLRNAHLHFFLSNFCFWCLRRSDNVAGQWWWIGVQPWDFCQEAVERSAT